jgi:hypothetical protein
LFGAICFGCNQSLSSAAALAGHSMNARTLQILAAKIKQF